MKGPKKEGILFIKVIIGIIFSISLVTEPVVQAHAATHQEQKGIIPLKVYRLFVDPRSGQHVVVLADSKEARGLFVWIGPFEANAINSELQGITPLRPLTHDLVESIINKTNLKVKQIVITHIDEGVYIAKMVIESGGSAIEIDVRPSDSIVIALKFKLPVYASETLFEKMSVELEQQVQIEEDYGLSIQEVTASLAKAFSYGEASGVLVSEVKEASRAEKDGIKRGDIIMEVAGEHIETMASLRNALKKIKTPVQAKIFREARPIFVTVHPK